MKTFYLLSYSLVIILSACAGPQTRGLKLKKDFITEPVAQVGEQQNVQNVCDRGALSWGVVIGINDYRSDQITDLEGASIDAWTMYHYLTSPYGGKIPTSQVKLLINEQATRAQIEGAIGNLRACPQDHVYLYFAGHGLPEPGKEENAFLLTYDSEPNNLVGSAISMQKLPEFLKWRVGKASELVMIIDACHSGNIQIEKTRGLKLKPTDPLVLSTSTERIKALNQNIQRFSESTSGWGVISASASDQLANESTKSCIINGEKYTGGLFTCHVIKGVSGEADFDKNKDITISELYEFVKNNVDKSTSGKQIPQFSGSMKLDSTIFSAPKNEVFIPVPPQSIIRGVDSQKNAQFLIQGTLIASGLATVTGVIFHALAFQTSNKANNFRPTQSSQQDFELIESNFSMQKTTSQVAYGIAITSAIIAGVSFWYQSTSVERERDEVYSRPPWLKLNVSSKINTEEINAGHK